jgi:hypothetical protein
VEVDDRYRCPVKVDCAEHVTCVFGLRSHAWHGEHLVDLSEVDGAKEVGYRERDHVHRRWPDLRKRPVLDVRRLRFLDLRCAHTKSYRWRRARSNVLYRVVAADATARVDHVFSAAKERSTQSSATSPRLRH